MNYLTYLFQLVIQMAFEYKPVALIILVSLIFIISSFTFSSKITLKKKKNLLHLKTSKKVLSIIEKSKFLKSKRDKLSIDIALISQKNHKSNINIANNLICSLCIAFLTITFISLVFIKYLILKVITPICFIYIALLILSYELNKRRRIAKRDFGKVVKIYTSNYARTRNILKSFQLSIYDIPDSHKYEFNRLIDSMGAASSYFEALDEYAARINDTMCFLFVEILKVASKRNDNVLYALIDLENYIAADKKSEKFKNNKLNDKKLNIYLGIFCCFGAFAIDYYLVGDYVKVLFFKNFFGQIFILISFVIIALILMCIRIFNQLL